MSRYLRALICLMICAGVSSYINAETVSQREAKHIAKSFFNAAYGQVMADPIYVYNGKGLTTNRLFSPFYVFNHPAGGFVVVSAENKAFPILGYSLTENFDVDTRGEATEALLRMYAHHIENIRYDSTIPDRAIYAWQHIPEHIYSILNAEYKATDSGISREEAMAELAHTAELSDADASASAFYSPDQWEAMINDELHSRGYLPLGLITGDKIWPTVVHGNRGDYYRLTLDGANRQLWRLMPTEIISAGEIAAFGTPPVINVEETEETPFLFYESFIAANADAYERDRASIENALVLTKPVVSWHGLGHYTVSLPENVMSMRVLGLNGTIFMSEKFRDTNQAHLNLTQLPTGFYFAVLFGESGKPYSVKLFR